MDFVENCNNVELNEIHCITKPVQGFSDQWQEVLVFDGKSIKAMVVYTKLQTAFWLLDKMYRYGNR